MFWIYWDTFWSLCFSAVWLTTMFRIRTLRSRQVDEPKSRALVTFDHTNLALGAAMDGLGVAIAPAYLIEGELRAGRLIAPFPELMAPDDSHYVLCRTGQENRPPLRRSMRLWSLFMA